MSRPVHIAKKYMDVPPRVLVTGASSGIGEAIARQAAEAGAKVILVARRAQALEAIAESIRGAGHDADWIEADLTVDAERERLIDRVHERHGSVDVIVSNAGAGWYGPTWELEWQTARDLVELDVMATLRLTIAFLPEMIARGSGQLIVMGSIAGTLPAQGISLYAASKAFVESFCRSVYRETRRTGVSVSLIKPGVVRTGFFAASERASGRRVPFSGGGVTPRSVARRAVRMIARPRRVAYVPSYLRIVPLVSHLFGWLFDLAGPIALRTARR